MAAVTTISKEEAIKLLTERAHWSISGGPAKDPGRCTNCNGTGRTDDPREDYLAVHSFSGFMGADWSLEAAVEFVLAANAIEWEANVFEHDLAVTSGGRHINFAVRSPSREAVAS